MNIEIQELSYDMSLSLVLDGYHVLTVAESGFSMLDLYGRKYRINRDATTLLADEVNGKDETGSLYPRAPISAVPRRFFRTETSSQLLFVELQRYVESFILLNQSQIMASQILVDFHVSSLAVPSEIVNATTAAFATSKSAAIIDNVLIRA